MNPEEIKAWFRALAVGLYGKVRVFFGEDMPVVTTPLSHELPHSLMGYLPYISWDPVTHLYQNEKSAGMVIEVGPMGHLTENQHEQIAQIFNNGLPAGIQVQIISWASPKIGKILDTWARSRSQGGPIYEELARHRRKHLMRGVWSSLSNSEPFSLRDYRVFIALELTGDVDGDAGKELLNIYSTIEGTFKPLGSYCRMLPPAELLEFVRCVLNPTSDMSPDNKGYDTEKTIREQVVSGDTMLNVFRDRLITSAWAQGDTYDHQGPELPDTAKRENYEIRTYSADRFPVTSTQATMSALLGDFFNPQLQPVGSTLTMLYFSPWTFEATKTLTEMKTLRMTSQASGMQGKISPTVKSSAEDWQQMNEDVATGGKLVNMGLFCASITPEGLGNRAEMALRNVWTNAGFGLVANNMMHLQTLLGCLPLSMGALHKDFDTMKRLRKMPAATMALLAPLQGEYRGTKLAHTLLVGRRGQLFFWSPFSNGEEGGEGGNHNVSVIGSSGSGKSFFMQDIACSLRGGGAHIMVLDDGRSFENLCKIQGGQFIEFTLASGLCIDPFTMFDHSMAARDEDYRDECRESIRALVLQMALGEDTATKEEVGAIAQAVNWVWETMGREGSIDAVGERLKAEFGEIGRVMYNGMSEYRRGGSYYDLYNGECTLKIDNEFTVFELSPIETKKELRSCVILGLLMLIRQRMKHGGRGLKKALFIDEAWQLLGNGAAGPFIEGFARRCRKEGGALITGTQSLEDYQATAGGRACINNSDWNIVLRLKEEALNSFEQTKILSATPGDMRIMRSLTTKQGQYSEAYIRGPGPRMIGRLVADPYTAKLYSTKAEDFDAMQRLVAQGVDVREAVAMLAYGTRPKIEATEGERAFYEKVLEIPTLRKMFDEYLMLDEEGQAEFIRRSYHYMRLRDAEAA